VVSLSGVHADCILTLNVLYIILQWHDHLAGGGHYLVFVFLLTYCMFCCWMMHCFLCGLAVDGCIFMHALVMVYIKQFYSKNCMYTISKLKLCQNSNLFNSTEIYVILATLITIYLT